MATYPCSISLEFWQDLGKLSQDVLVRVQRALWRMFHDPWASELHPEKVKSAEPGVYSARVDDKYRIIWKHIKPNDIVFCLIDKHDAAYQRAVRKSFVLEDGMLKVTDIVNVGAKKAEATGDIFAWKGSKGERLGALFVGYKDAELIEMGVPADCLVNVRSLDDVNQMEVIERLLPEEVFLRLLGIALGEVERPIVKDEELRQSLERHQGGDELVRFVNSEEFQRALAGNMQEWMLFLAAPQRFLVTRQYNGPARLRGVAGSGKTVIAIHRARQLAQAAQQKDQRVLFITYGNRLPSVIHYLLTRLAGDDAPELGAIECRTIHDWCAQFLNQRGITLCVKDGLQQECLKQAIQVVRPRYHDLKLMQRSSSFFSDEIRFAIKGKAIQSLEEYLTLERSGRGTALGARERQAVYEIYQGYQRSLEAQGCCDFDDFILLALREIEQSGFDSPYRSAIVDELQDLTEATLRLIRRIVPAGPDDLFLVGDGLQRIYPGGISLPRIQVDVTGRSALLRRNYRNTQEILRAAHAMMRNLPYDDLEDEPAEAAEPEYSLRRGEVPILRRFSTPEQEIAWVAQEVAHLQSQGICQPAEIAVIYRYRNPYRELIANLMGVFEPVELDKDPFTYFGPGLKHTTFHSAKGLEFKVVFAVGVTDGWMVPRDDWSLQGIELSEYLARERRLLYVAMTRARDRLYLSCARGASSRFLNSVPQEHLRRG
jgi:superfamily I DNA/RNA helicase/Txe/YoeB family toxin of Txe-Axe toxin-antitoxin module